MSLINHISLILARSKHAATVSEIDSTLEDEKYSRRKIEKSKRMRVTMVVVELARERPH